MTETVTVSVHVGKVTYKVRGGGISSLVILGKSVMQKNSFESNLGLSVFSSGVDRIGETETNSERKVGAKVRINTS